VLEKSNSFNCHPHICPRTEKAILPLLRKHSPDGATPDRGSGHLIAAYYSVIDHKRMKGWVGLVGGLVADVRTDGHLKLALCGRLCQRVDLKSKKTNQHVKLKIKINTHGADDSKFMMQIIHGRVVPSNTQNKLHGVAKQPTTVKMKPPYSRVQLCHMKTSQIFTSKLSENH